MTDILDHDRMVAPPPLPETEAEAARLGAMTMQGFGQGFGLTPAELIEEIEAGRLQAHLPRDAPEADGSINYLTALMQWGIVTVEAGADWIKAGSPRAERCRLEILARDEFHEVNIR